MVPLGNRNHFPDSANELLSSAPIGSQQSDLTLPKPRRSHTSPFTTVNPVQQSVQTPESSDQPSSDFLAINQQVSLPPTVTSSDSRSLPSIISSYLGNCPISPVLPSQNSVENPTEARSANAVHGLIDEKQVCSSPNSTSLMNLDNSDNYTITELRSSSQSMSSAASFSQTAQDMNDINYIAQCAGFAASTQLSTVKSNSSYSITSNELAPFMQEKVNFSQVNEAANDGDTTHTFTLPPQYSYDIDNFDDDLAGLNDVEKNLKLNRVYQVSFF